MPALRAQKGAQLVSLFLVITSAALFGCGSAASSSVETTQFKQSVESQIAMCLERGGASLATSPEDLTFLIEAEANESVSKVGVFYEKRTRQVIQTGTAATFELHPPEWSVWFGQSLKSYFNSALSPIELVEAPPSGSFVMFVNHPSRRERARTTSCLRIGGSAEGHEIRRTEESF